jgi:hypothetical protein
MHGLLYGVVPSAYSTVVQWSAVLILFEKRVYEYMLCRAFLKKIPHWQGPFLFGVGRLTFDAFN